MPDKLNPDGVFISCVSDEFEKVGAPFPGLRGQLRGDLARTRCNVRVKEDFPQTPVTHPQNHAKLPTCLSTTIHSANGPNPGGSITLSVGPRGEKPKWEVQTQGVHNGSLKLEVPAGELGSLQDFDLHVTLHSSSGVENGDKACATLSKLTIQAKRE